MKLHIGTLNISVNTIPSTVLPCMVEQGFKTGDAEIPAIGDKWPGTDAVYAGITLSHSGDALVHLILWPQDENKGMSYDQAVEWAEQLNPAKGSHIPTRQQSITLFERLRDQFNTDYWHWTLTKTASGKSAFRQYFLNGFQGDYDLSAELRVRAVSEIPL